MLRRPPRRGFRESLMRSFGTLACPTMRLPNTSVGFHMVDRSNWFEWSCTNAIECAAAGGDEQRRSCIMTKSEHHPEQMESLTPIDLIPSAFIAMGRKQIHERVKAHSELVDKIQEVN